MLWSVVKYVSSPLSNRDVLSFPTELVQTPDGANTYFNRSDVKAAMHAPMDVDWAECATS